MILPVLMTLLWSLVEVHSQIAPYVSFMGETLPNHSYVDLTLVGNPVLDDDDHSVQCHTDLSTCCSGGQGEHRGDWYFPNGDRLPFSSGGGDIYEQRGAQQVELRRRRSANSPSGIYLCDITTIAVQDNSVRETVYVGLYATGGDLTISDITLDEDSANNEFTLTCISIGGPATTVTWTRGSETAVGERITVFDTTTTATTAQYTHTLTVTGRLAGLYECTVANDMPSSDSAMLNLDPQPPTNVMAAQESPTSIQVSWTPSPSVRDTTGYRIEYTSDGGSSDSATVSGDTTTHLLEGLQSGETYTISIITISDESTSDPSVVVIHLNVTVASAPTNVMAVQEGPTSIRVSWTPSSGATGYIISYTGGGSSDSVTVSGGSTDNYLLTGLVMEASYTISIVATQQLPSNAVVVEITLIPAPGQPSVSAVTSITTTSISLSWSVPSDSVVTSSEVMWREASSGTSEGTSGSLTDTSYTIDQLESNTIYNITVTVSNTAGSTDSQPVIISTTSDSCDDSCQIESSDCACSETDNTPAIIGGVVVAIVLILSITTALTVIVIVLVRSRRGDYSTRSKGEVAVTSGATNKELELSKFSEEATYADPETVIQTSSNEAYGVTKTARARGGDAEYETVPAVPPSISHSTQPPTDDYEPV